MSYRADQSFNSGSRGARGRTHNKQFYNQNRETYSPQGFRDHDKKSESFDGEKRYDKVGGGSDSGGFNHRDEDPLSKARGGDRVPEILDPSMREVFPFRIFIKDDYLKEGLASRNETDDIIRQAGIDSITMDN